MDLWQGIDNASRKLDDVVLKSRILLEGEVLYIKEHTSVPDILQLLESLCRGRACYANIDLEDIEGKEENLQLFAAGDIVIGAIATTQSGKVYGREALIRFLERASSSSYRLAYVRVYSFDPALIEGIYREIERIAERPRIEERIEARPSAIAELRKKILEDLHSLGIPVQDVAVAEGEHSIAINIVCDKGKSIPPPKQIAFAVLKNVGEVGTDIPMVTVAIHHKKTYSETFDSRDRDLVRALGLVAELILKMGLYIDKIDYRVRDRDLELRLSLKRESIYSSISIRDVAQRLYDELSKVWRGRISLRVRMGLLGIEVKLP